MSADRITELKSQMELMVMYAEMKLAQKDWHGLSDAANDLREMEVELRILREETPK